MADFNGLLKVTDHTAEYNQKDIEDNRAMGILSYLGFLVLIPILAAKGSKFARFHANQGLVLFIADVILGVILNILSVMSKMFLIGWIFGVLNALLSLVSLGFFVLAVMGIVFAAQGKAKDLPLIGGIKLIK